MTFSELATAVERAVDSAGGVLISPRARSDLLHLARSAPPVTHVFGFECRLTPQDDRVDLGIGVSALDGAAELAQIGTRGSWPHLEREERWLRIGRLARAWAEHGTPLNAWAPFLFLEFDEESAASVTPVPSIFVGLDSPLEGSSAASPELEAARQVASLLAPDDETASDRLEHAFACLPTGSRALHVGVMLGRSQPSLRLSVLLPGSDPDVYLHRLGHLAASELALKARGDLAGMLEHAQLDFDLGPGPIDRIGFGLRPDERGPTGWRTLLESLPKSGSLSAPKCAALLHWPGTSLLDGWSMQREISHVKLACTSEGPAQLKAYFGVTPTHP
jgi:hypothetical protein